MHQGHMTRGVCIQGVFIGGGLHVGSLHWRGVCIQGGLHLGGSACGVSSLEECLYLGGLHMEGGGGVCIWDGGG